MLPTSNARKCYKDRLVPEDTAENLEAQVLPSRFHSLLGSQGGTSLLMSPRAHSSTHGATVFVLVFSYPNFK